MKEKDKMQELRQHRRYGAWASYRKCEKSGRYVRFPLKLLLTCTVMLSLVMGSISCVFAAPRLPLQAWYIELPTATTLSCKTLLADRNSAIVEVRMKAKTTAAESKPIEASVWTAI